MMILRAAAGILCFFFYGVQHCYKIIPPHRSVGRNATPCASHPCPVAMSIPPQRRPALVRRSVDVVGFPPHFPLTPMIRARERVRDDAALVGEVSSAVSAALGLDAANRTLGRQVVIAVSETFRF